MAQNDHETVDMLLVGAGIMSATLAVLLKELDPNLKMEVVELQESGAIESSNPWNNAGTGHAGLCELNYTPQSADGSIDIKKAVGINTMFEVSKQFWSHLVAKGTFGSPKTFINPVPHLSFVRGSEGIAYLKKRFESLTKHHAFETMVYSEDKATLAEWMPLMMPGRPADEAIAATRVEGGTDVNFGALTNQLLQHLAQQPGAQIRYNQKVTHLRRADNGWRVTVKDTRNGGDREIQARFVFLGAGGGALLPKSGAWMNGVRNAFGVLLLAVAVWLLERVVSGPVALMLWGMLAGGAGLALGALEFTPKSAARRLLQLLGLMFLTYAVAAWIGALQGESDPIHPLGRSVPSIHAGPPSTPGEWQNLTTPAQLDAALAEARQAGKPVLLDWYADWCISCKVIERQVLTDPTVQARLPAYRLLRFDITESNPAQRGLLDRYNLFGPPAILFFAPGGDEWSDLRVIGEIDAAGLAERLRRAATRQ